MQKRRILLAGAAVAALVAAGIATGLLFGGCTTSGEAPSPVAGDPVPATRERPLARIAVAGDTGTGDATDEPPPSR